MRLWIYFEGRAEKMCFILGVRYKTKKGIRGDISVLFAQATRRMDLLITEIQNTVGGTGEERRIGLNILFEMPVKY